MRQLAVRVGALVKDAGLALMLALPVAGAVSSHAWAQASCAQLEASLSALDRNSNARNSQQQAARIRGELDRLSAQARNMGCDAPRGFFIFQGPPRPPQCDQISDQISRLRSSLASAESGSGGDTSGQRRALIIALAQNNCGAQYTAAVRQATPQQQRPRNIFEAIFGAPFQNDAESAPDLDVVPLDVPKSSTYKTVCVRTCDGYFFPMSDYANASRFASDEIQCRRLCPAADTQLFAFHSSGEDIKSATNIAGQSYMSLPNALRYRKEVVPSCSCRAPGQSWAQALAGIEDKTTLQKGDILVTEEQAREMSLPKLNEPAPGTRGKSASNAAPGSQVDAPSLAATAAAPLAPASEQPGQRKVRIIPLPRSRSLQQAQEAAASADVGAGSVIAPASPGASTGQ